MNFKTKLMALTATALTVPGLAMAQAVDISDATDAFGSASTAIAAIGVAMVAAAAAGIVYRWVTAFMVK